MNAKIMRSDPNPELNVMVAKITVSSYPGQFVYCTDMCELRYALGVIMGDNSNEFGIPSAELNFDDLMDPGDEIHIEMEYMPVASLKKLEDFKKF